ncbi:MAG: DNA primase [Candidatus Binatia bacterium]
MTGRIRDDAIRDIRERASIVEVISDVVALRRRGASFVGLCPFHTEKTPSFTVSQERGFYHCFGCGEHGDVFGFVMRLQGLAFPEAVRSVAERFGLPVPEEAGAPRTPVEPLVAMNAAAAAFFRRALLGPGGEAARAYLAQRGLREETMTRFGLGFAPASGDALARHVRAQGLRIEDALTVGLVLQRAGGGVYDRFRDRVMFPIVDPSGRIVAFGGRILPGHPATGDPPPKYLNSPESPLFHKGHTVYGLGPAREAIRKRGRAVVVEGYMDVLALAEAGLGEVVAPLGTALTVDQLRVLRRFTDVVIACFDGDEAGRRAAARSFPVCIEAGLWGRGAFLPSGQDPDTFVRSAGLPALETLLAGAAPLVDAYLAQLAGPQRDAVGRRAEAAREVARILKQVRGNPYEFEVLVRLAADRLGVNEETLRSEGAPGPAATGAVTFAGAPPDAAEEQLLVELMASDPRVTGRVRAANVIAEFEHEPWRRAAEAIAAAGDDAARTAAVDGLPRALRDRVVRRLLGEYADEDRERAVADCLARIDARRQRQLTGRLREEMRAAAARGDVAAERAAMRQLKDLTEKVRTS